MQSNKIADYDIRAKFIASSTLAIIIIVLIVVTFVFEKKVELKSLQTNSVYVTQYITKGYTEDNVQKNNKTEQKSEPNLQPIEIKHEDATYRKIITETSTSKLDVIEQQKFEVKNIKTKTDTKKKSNTTKKKIITLDQKEAILNEKNNKTISESNKKQILKQSLAVEQEFNNNSDALIVSQSNNVNNSFINENSGVDILSVLIARVTKLKRYPRRAQILDIEGTTELSVFVDANGYVVKTFVSKKSNSYLLDKETEKLGEKLIGYNVGYIGTEKNFLIPVVYQLR
jgi:outer membrane biosynthesis protein TonB